MSIPFIFGAAVAGIVGYGVYKEKTAARGNEGPPAPPAESLPQGNAPAGMADTVGSGDMVETAPNPSDTGGEVKLATDLVGSQIVQETTSTNPGQVAAPAPAEAPPPPPMEVAPPNLVAQVAGSDDGLTKQDISRYYQNYSSAFGVLF